MNLLFNITICILINNLINLCRPHGDIGCIFTLTIEKSDVNALKDQLIFDGPIFLLFFKLIYKTPKDF